MKKHSGNQPTLLSSILALLLCLSMLLGTTAAWFTDSVTSSRNTITAGRLDVEMEYLKDGQWKPVEASTVLFDANSLWEPGHTEVAYLRISNAGDLALKYLLGVQITNQTGSVNVAGEGFMLSDYIELAVLEDVQTPYPTREELRQAVTVSAPLSDGYTREDTILPGAEPHYVAMVIFMPETVGNEANTAAGQTPPSIELGVHLTATQRVHESDSFGNTYDSFAQFPREHLDVTVATPVQGKMENGVMTQPVTVVGGGSGVTAQIPQGVALEQDATALTLSVKTMDASNANITLEENEVSASVDVHIAGVAETNTVPMQVTLANYLPVGLNIGSLKLYHVENGNTVTMTHVDTPVNHNEFSYDPLTGTVQMAIASFSEVALVADTDNTWNGASASGFAGGTGTENDPWLIASADQMAYFRDQVDAGNTYAGQFIKLTNDIELSNVNFDPIGYGYDYDGYTPNGKTFNGTFDGDHYTIKDLYQSGWSLGSAYSYSMAGGGLFASAVDATFKNVHISGAHIRMECVDMGILVGYSQGNCTYDHIRIYNSRIANYQRATGGVIGEVSPKRGADGKPVSNTNVHTIKDVVIGNNVVVGSLWGDFDNSVGGIIGARWDDDNATQVVMEDVTVGCRLDVYNDVTSSYKWHAYRRAGMLIGNTDTPAADGRTAKTATADFLTCNSVVVELGNWADYHYCQFVNDYNTDGNKWPWVRVEQGENCDAYSNPRYGHPKDANGNPVTNDIHAHNAGESCRLLIPFAQLYGGGQGVYGATEHPGVTITTPLYTIAYMDGTEVEEVIYVNDNSKPYDLKNAGEHMNWLDSEGRPITQIPAGNTKNVVVHLDDATLLIAHFLDLQGMEIYSEQFVEKQAALKYVPPVPEISGYVGQWEPYDLPNATASIVIKPYYTLESGATVLDTLTDLDQLFTWISEGRTVVMTQQLEGSQGNASQDNCCDVTTHATDKEARLNLNGYTLTYDFGSNGNKDWHIFNIHGDSTLNISGGITHDGILRMQITELNKNAIAHMFEMEPGAKLVLEKGAIVELHYPAGRSDDVAMFYINNHVWKPTPEEYPTLQFTNVDNVKRLVALETTVIEVPQKT